MICYDNEKLFTDHDVSQLLRRLSELLASQILISWFNESNSFQTGKPSQLGMCINIKV